ncbi:MAG: tail fiber domain-containing protein [Planctomycetota bacterium]
MFTKTRIGTRCLALVAAAGLAATALAAPVGTSFTYQGLLENSGVKVNTPTNVAFRLFDAATGGTQQGSTINQIVTPDEGVFSSTLDFGASPFEANEALWLEITVEGTTLDRQKLESSPFALNTRGLEVDDQGFRVNVAAGSVGMGAVDGSWGVYETNSSGEPTNNFMRFVGFNDTKISAGAFMRLFVQSAERVLVQADSTQINNDVHAFGDVGIGTVPLTTLDVQGNEEGTGNTTITARTGLASAIAAVELVDAAGPKWLMQKTAANDFVILEGDSVNPDDPRLAIEPGGDVGIGTISPRARLDIVSESIPSGVSPDPNSDLIIDAAFGDASISLVAPKAVDEKVIRFTNEDFETAGAIVFDAFSDFDNDKNSMSFRIGEDVVMHVDDTRRVGINTGFFTPDFDLEVNGTAGKPGGGSWSNSSDRRLKTNIADLNGALDTLLALKGVTYEYKNPEAINELPGERVGFIAQDVEMVMPDWIDEGENGYKRLTIRGFEAIAVEAIREQQAQIDAMQAELDSLRGGAPFRSSLTWPVVVGAALFGGFAVARRRQAKA